MHRVPVLERVGTLARKKRLTMPNLASFVVKEWSLFCFHSASRYSIERIKRLKSILKSLGLLLSSPLRLVTVGVALPRKEEVGYESTEIWTRGADYWCQ